MKNYTSKILIIISFILLTGLPSFTQNNLDWLNAWQYGPSEAVELDSINNLLYLASGGAVLILDVSDPAMPVLINKDIRTRGQILDIHMDYDDEHLLLACDEAGMEIWDVTNINDPNRIGGLEIFYGGVETPVRHVELYQDYAVTENRWGYIHTIDISDPANPYQVAFNGMVGNPAHDISVSEDGYIHATGQQYYALLKINPDGSLNVSGSQMANAGSIYGTVNASYMNFGGNLYIIDRTQPGSSSTALNFNDIVVRNGMAFLIDASNDMFMIYDVTDIYSPVMIGQVEVNGFVNQLAVMGDHAYISDGFMGLKVVDFSDPASPQIIGEYEGTGVTWTSTTVNGYSYIANSSSGLSILDVSDPEFNPPVRLGNIPSNGETRDVAIQDDYAFIADYDGGLRIFDVSNPASPMSLSSVEGINVWRVEVDGNILCIDEAIPNEADILRTYDITDINNPVELGSLSLPDLVFDILYHEGYVYVANYDEGLRVIKITDLYNPVEVAVIDLPDVIDIDIEGNMAYVASSDWDGGLVSIDISDPEDPVIINIYNPSGWFHPFHVSVIGNYAYTGENFGDLKMFDISDPANPAELESYITSGSIVKIESVDNSIYVSDAADGLQIFRNDLITNVDDIEETMINSSVYPNPFREQTTISFVLDKPEIVTVHIYDINGKKVETIYSGKMQKGPQRLHWNISEGSSAGNIFFYQISGKDIYESGMMIKQN